MKHVFGKSITYSFTPLIDGNAVDAYSLTSARIYSTVPTNAQKEDHAATEGGFIGSAVTSWVSNGNSEYLITFPAITDSSPHDADSYETYYVVVSFKFESGGSNVFASESIHLYRPDAWTSRITTSFLDVIALETKIDKLKSEVEITRFINLAKERIFRRLKRLGGEKRKLFNLEELNDATLYLAASMICADLASEDAQFWMTKSDRHNEAFEEIFSASTPGLNVNEELDPGETTISSGPAWVQR